MPFGSWQCAVISRAVHRNAEAEFERAASDLGRSAGFGCPLGHGRNPFLDGDYCGRGWCHFVLVAQGRFADMYRTAGFAAPSGRTRLSRACHQRQPRLGSAVEVVGRRGAWRHVPRDRVLPAVRLLDWPRALLGPFLFCWISDSSTWIVVAAAQAGLLGGLLFQYWRYRSGPLVANVVWSLWWLASGLLAVLSTA